MHLNLRRVTRLGIGICTCLILTAACSAGMLGGNPPAGRGTSSPGPGPNQQSQPTGSGPSETPPEAEPSGIPLEVDKLQPPIPPSITAASAEAGYVELEWNGTGSDIVVHYTIYRRTASTEVWEEIASIPAEGDNRGQYVFEDHTVKGGSTYEYAITATDLYENESMLSEIVQISY